MIDKKQATRAAGGNLSAGGVGGMSDVGGPGGAGGTNGAVEGRLGGGRSIRNRLQLEQVEPLLISKLEEVLAEAPTVDGTWLVAPLLDGERTAEEQRDFLATRLMEVFRIHQSRAAFGLLYELCGPHLLQMVASRLRRYQSKADPNDVLQEVYVNIYRYPHRFDSSRDDAFRLWTSTIVRNTVLKHLRSLSRSGRAEVGFEDLPDPPEPRENGPLQGVLRNEAQEECSRVYLTYLHLYLQFYRLLSEREQRAIHLVEVEECSYRQAAGELGIKLENLKMVIFRARRKIHRSMRRVFEGLPPDVRPARAPRSKSQARATTTRASGLASGLDSGLASGRGRGSSANGSKIVAKVGAGSKTKGNLNRDVQSLARLSQEESQ